MAQSVIIPPPYQGQNDKYPLVSISSPYAQKMYNMNNKGGSVNLRQGNDKFAELQTVDSALNIVSYNDSNFFLLVDRNAAGLGWYDITSGVPALVHSLAGGGDVLVYTLYFNKYLFYFGEGTLLPASTGPQYFDGAAWGTAGYTWPSGSIPLGGNVYKNRAYFILGYASGLRASYGYSGIDAISGAVTQVDLSGVVSADTLLYAICSISLSENVTQDAVQAFLFANGEILVYSGSYPASANWSLISRFKISELLYYNCFAEAKGDVFVLTKSEILSLRNIFAKGYSKEKEEGIGSKINKRWKQITNAISGQPKIYIKATYDGKNDRLIISLPFYIDPSTSAITYKPFQLIYDFTLEAWYEYFQKVDTNDTNSGTYSLATHALDVYFLSSNGTTPPFSAHVMKLEAKTDFLDDEIKYNTSTELAIAYDLVTAPLPIPKFGANAIDGVEIICKSDLYPQTNYKFIADLGRQTTEAQPLVAQGTSVAKPMANVGLHGATLAQLEISGSSVSASVGLELYAFNIWFNAGAQGSR